MKNTEELLAVTMAQLEVVEADYASLCKHHAIVEAELVRALNELKELKAKT